MGPLLLLLIAGVASVHCHSLQYYYTGVSIPGHGLPEFSIVGYVDGIQITHYSSETSRIVPVVRWMQKVEPDYWETETQIGKSNEELFKHNVKTVMDCFNHSTGETHNVQTLHLRVYPQSFHSLQWMYGCELRDDGSIRGYYQYGYDGRDFLVLDTEREIFIALTDQAQMKAQRVNSPSVRAGKRDKRYLETECIDWLKKHLVNGEEQLTWAVRPEVKVSDQNVNGVTKLHCQVYGFHPRDVDVNCDGTYQIRVTVEVAADDREGHSCHVEHASLDQTLTVKWDFDATLIVAHICVCAYNVKYRTHEVQ
uniref:MHC class I-like antigen recognition-like domain-containing protein n=1 Tax=Leptobrachium leishanense TaxID=445787 RepID=A0A8C5MMP4_9ANUR